jgi:phospholipase/carboxylesterase
VQHSALSAITVGTMAEAEMVVVFLHGHAMSPEDFAPFAQTLGVPACFHFLRGPCELEGGARAWWLREPSAGDRGAPPWDLAQEHPAQRAQVRRALACYLDELGVERGHRPLMLAGFSQGGMLACDTLLLEDIAVDAMALMSSCRIAFDEWQPRLARASALPVLLSHGRADEHLAFSAGAALRDALSAGGARVDWLPFEGGHEVSLLVWRRLRDFMRTLIGQAQAKRR